MNVDKSLLDRNQSTWLKGVLILLIALGHNSILMGTLPETETRTIYRFLYCFHAYAFFFVTCLYNWPKLSKEHVKKIFLRLYKPYTIMFVIVLVANLFITKSGFIDMGGVILAYLSGSSPLLKDAIGMSFVWFLPTMFSFLLILGGCRDESPRYLRVLLLVLAIGFLTLLTCGLLGLEVSVWSVSGSMSALRIFTICYLNRLLFEKFGARKAYQYMAYATALFVVLVFFTRYGQSVVLDRLLRFLLVPSAMFQLLVVIVYRIKHYNKMILYLGRHSLQIYLFHHLIYNVILMGLRVANIPLSTTVGIVVYISTLVATIAFDVLFRKTIPAAYNFMYSKRPSPNTPAAYANLGAEYLLSDNRAKNEKMHNLNNIKLKNGRQQQIRSL